jgi:hypothetical protein
MPRVLESFTEGSVEFAVGEDLAAVTIDASCQITAVTLTATTSTTTTPGVLCDPSEVDVPNPSKFALDLVYNQDNKDDAGLSAFLWENDAVEGTFTILTAAGNPSVTGRCYFVAGNYGGEAGKPMTDTKTLSVIGKPTRVFGTAAYVPPAADDQAANGNGKADKRDKVDA